MDSSTMRRTFRDGLVTARETALVAAIAVRALNAVSGHVDNEQTGRPDQVHDRVPSAVAGK